MPLGYQTELSDGAGLSGWTKATNCSSTRPANKISNSHFDEATSGLDVLTEKKVIDNLMGLKDKRLFLLLIVSAFPKRTNQIDCPRPRTDY